MGSNMAERDAGEILQRQLGEYDSKLTSLRSEMRTLAGKRDLMRSEKENE